METHITTWNDSEVSEIERWVLHKDSLNDVEYHREGKYSVSYNKKCKI